MRPETPVTLKEQLLAKMNGDDITIPIDVISYLPIEDLLIAKIAGLIPNLPDIDADTLPLTLKFIASIAGFDVYLPEPVTHFQQIIAYAAGIRESAPNPITREEMYWYDYAGGTPAPTVIENHWLPPITFVGNGEDLMDYHISGNTVQNGEPSLDNPVEVVGCGQRTGNLLNPSGIVESSAVSIGFISSNTISVSARTDSTNFLQGLIDVYDECIIGNEVTISAGSFYGVSGSIYAYGMTASSFTTEAIQILANGSNNFIVPINSDRIRIYFRINKQGGLNIGDTGYFNDVYVTLGTTAPDHYIPYGYKVPVTVSGVNLLDMSVSNWEQGTIMTGGMRESASARIKMKEKMAILPDTDYTVRAWGDVVPAFHLWKDDKYISDSTWITNQERTFNTENGNLIEFVLRRQNNDSFVPGNLDGTRLVQLSHGSTPPSHYEPYHEPITAPVYIGDEPLHKIGDYADYVDYARNVVVRRIKKLVLTGEEQWEKYVRTNTTYESPVSRSKPSSDAFSTHYAEIPATQFDLQTGFYIRNSAYAIVSDTRYETVMDFKSFLSTQYEAGTPVTIWYVLAEPEEIPLDNLNPIPTINGTNILSVETEVQPSEMYIKGKIKEIETDTASNSNAIASADSLKADVMPQYEDTLETEPTNKEEIL